jgi:hypothetical protein
MINKKMMQEMQKNIEKKIMESQSFEVEAESGAGLVKVIIRGNSTIKELKIDDSLLSEDKEIMEDLISAAVNKGLKDIEVKKQEHMGDFGGLNGLF